MPTLGLALYVLGYGVGPRIFAPLSDIPWIGRNPVYVIIFRIFVILGIPTAVVDNFGGLLALRFLQGFLAVLVWPTAVTPSEIFST